MGDAVLAEDMRWGFWRCYDRLRALAHGWNHKRGPSGVLPMKLNVPRRTQHIELRFIPPGKPDEDRGEVLPRT